MDTDKHIDDELTEDETKEVYAKYGLTAYMSQLFERELGTFLVHIIQSQNLSWPLEKPTALFEHIPQKTLGHLLNELKKKIQLDPEIEQTLIDAVSKRNYLVHRFYYDNAYKFVSKKGQKEMISELDTMIELFNKAAEFSFNSAKETRKLIGYNENEIDSLTDQIMKREIKNFSETGNVSPGF